MPSPVEPLSLSNSPTPLQRLERLSQHLDVPVYMKRDDLTGDIGLGGNKVRKLEFLLAEALSQGATHVLTTGGPQSNHARATAAAAARLGLTCTLVLAGKDPGTRHGNLLLNELYGADIRFPGAVTPEEQVQALHDTAAELAAQGARPYIVPLGGSSPLGALGSLRCYEEMQAELPAGTVIACATGSGGTHAGLALGAARAGNRHQVIGYSVWQPAERIRSTTESLVREAAALLNFPLPPLTLHVDDRFLAPRYGKSSAGGLGAIALVAKLEGILLDHVYTGKAMAGLLHDIRTGAIEKGRPVCFVHTGGAPAVFAGW